MIRKVSNIKWMVVGMFFISASLLAQTQPEDVALNTDEFQESYYESLMQKGIENYDKAIASLEKCLKIQPENAVIYHELGKNYFFQKDYLNAEKNYTKATQIETQNKWFLIDLYEVYYTIKDYNQALQVVQKIVPLDKKYKEDLTSLYMYTQQFDKALVLINELDENVGKTELRDRYRLEINSQTKTNAGDKNELERAIDKSPKNEENYISLIYLFTDNNQEDKAYQVAQKLEKNIPESEWAQVFLFKYYINENKGDEAFKAMDRVFSGSKIDKKIKFRMFNEFLIFTIKNPTFESQLSKATTYFENDSDFDVHKEIGKFYYKKKSWDLALKNLEKAFQKNNADLETNIFLLATYEENKSYEAMLKTASELVDTFPNQPEYYFFGGKAAHKLNNFKKANDFLESGLDYVIENKPLEIDFLNQLSEVSAALGNPKKSSEYLTKANNIKNKKE
jgi:tetratricopeptide (TPR) repeat protein